MLPIHERVARRRRARRQPQPRVVRRGLLQPQPRRIGTAVYDGIEPSGLRYLLPCIRFPCHQRVELGAHEGHVNGRREEVQRGFQLRELERAFVSRQISARRGGTHALDKPHRFRPPVPRQQVPEHPGHLRALPRLHERHEPEPERVPAAHDARDHAAEELQAVRAREVEREHDVEEVDAQARELARVGRAQELDARWVS